MAYSREGRIVSLSLSSGSNIKIDLRGANVFSWRTSDGEERLYVSPKTPAGGSKTIRGGIPICFPNFKDGPTPQEVKDDPLLEPHASMTEPHAFVQSLQFDFEESSFESTPSSLSATFTLDPSLFPDPFPKHVRVKYTVTLREDKLESSFHIVNPSSAPLDFRFKALLHTFLAVNDSHQIHISPVKEAQKCIDVMGGFKEEVWAGGAVTVKEPIGRMFYNIDAPHGLTVSENSADQMKVDWTGFTDVIVWNPSTRAGNSVADMPAGDDRKMTCIEPGCVRSWRIIRPGESFVGTQTLTVLR